MADSQKKRKRRRTRTVPRNIGEKTGREIMETVFGKRVLREIHARLDAENSNPGKARPQEASCRPTSDADASA